MSELKTLTTDILVHISKELNVTVQGILATIPLLDEGGSVSFLARSRQEATGNLDEVAIGVL